MTCSTGAQRFVRLQCWRYLFQFIFLLKQVHASMAPHPFGDAVGHLLDLPNSVAQLRYFSDLARLYLDEGCDAPGNRCTDAQSLSIALKVPFEKQGRRGAIVDVGANVGTTLTGIIKVLLPYMHFVGGTIHPIHALAYEPNPDNLQELVKRTQVAFARDNVQIVPILAAVSNVSGKEVFFHRGKSDSRGSFMKDPELVEDEYQQIITPVRTLDEDFASLSSTIFLLKIDAEGFDWPVLQGCRRMLRQKRVKFIVFEFNLHLWQAQGSTLKHSINDLVSVGYICFLMAAQALIPISGVWWQAVYGAIPFSDIFCGVAGERDLLQTYLGFGTNNYTLAYALANL